MQLEVVGLTKSFGERLVLDDIDFTFETGKIYGLIESSFFPYSFSK